MMIVHPTLTPEARPQGLEVNKKKEALRASLFEFLR